MKCLRQVHVPGDGSDISEGDEEVEEEESSEAAEAESEDADMDEADISDDVDEEPPAVAAAGDETKGRKRSAADAGISAGK